MSMNPGMKMLMMDRMRQQNTENRSEYGGGNRRMIGYDRSENGNAKPRISQYLKSTPTTCRPDYP